MWESDADSFGQYSLQKLMQSTSSREHFHFPPNSYGGSPIHQVQQQTSFRVASDNKEHEPSFCPKKLWRNHWVSFVLNLSDLPFFLQLCSNPFARPWNCGPGFKINFSSYALQVEVHTQNCIVGKLILYTDAHWLQYCTSVQPDAFWHKLKIFHFFFK